MMRRRQIKRAVLDALALPEIAQVRRQLHQFSAREVVNPLFSALLSPIEIVRWHCIVAFGWTVATIADEDLEAARVIMRRFLWSLNDESGGIGWGAPEAMAEVMANQPQLAKEYLHMLVSYAREDGPELFQDGNFLELPALQRGLLWGLARMAETRNALIMDAQIVTELCSYLGSPDGEVRGLAIWTLIMLGDCSACQEVGCLIADISSLRIYHEGQMHPHTVGSLASQYLEQCC